MISDSSKAIYDLRFTMTLDEWVDYATAVRSSERLWAIWYQRLLLLISGIASSLLTLAIESGWSVGAVYVTLMVSAAFTAAFTMNRPWSREALSRQFRKHYRKQESTGLFDPQELRIDEIGFAHQARHRRLTVEWAALTDVSSVDGFTVLQSINGAVVIPAITFPGEASRLEFIAVISKLKAAHSAEPATDQKAKGFPVNLKAQ